MPTMAAQHWNVGEIVVNFEVDLTAAAAINTAAGSVRGDDIVATKTGTGLYTIRVVGRTFYEVLFRHAEFHPAGAANIVNAKVTAIDLDGAGDGTGAVITITTLDDYATPAAADVVAAGTISGQVVFRGSKVS